LDTPLEQADKNVASISDRFACDDAGTKGGVYSQRTSGCGSCIRARGPGLESAIAWNRHSGLVLSPEPGLHPEKTKQSPPACQE
jgi:hypothetical protein